MIRSAASCSQVTQGIFRHEGNVLSNHLVDFVCRDLNNLSIAVLQRHTFGGSSDQQTGMRNSVLRHEQPGNEFRSDLRRRRQNTGEHFSWLIPAADVSQIRTKVTTVVSDFIERLIQYMTRCPFSLSRLVKVSDSGQVIYQAEKRVCLAFPDPKGDGIRAGVKRNFQILEPLDFLAEFTQHIPPKGAHLIRYYGWYSNKSRGMRKKAAAAASVESSTEETAATGSSQAWAMLIKRVYEVDPLSCPECSGQMQVVSFIEPPQADVIEAILKHCGLWQSRSPRAPPEVDELVLELDAACSSSSIDSPGPADESQELAYVDIDTFLESF